MLPNVFPSPVKVPNAPLKSLSNPTVSAPIATIDPSATFDNTPEKPPTDSLKAPKLLPNFSIPVKFLSEPISFNVPKNPFVVSGSSFGVGIAVSSF